jgi:hypothetical protein
LVPAGGAGSEIPFFDEQRGDTPQGEVARDAGPGGPAADDQDFRFQVHKPRLSGAAVFMNAGSDPKNR